jgi:hypothetical protein
VTTYRIEFSIQRCDNGENDFREIGFGSSGACGTVDSAAYEVETIVQNRIWETGEGMPEPAATTAGED